MDQTKKTLVCYPTTSILNSAWIKNKLLENFNIECFNPATHYNPSVHVLVSERYDQSQWHVPFLQRGFKVIVEYFWDSFKDEVPIVQDQQLHIRSRDWSWIHAHLMNQHCNYDYRPAQSLSPDKFFLLLMNVTRDARDQLFDQVSPYLDDSLYSYRGRGITIVDDDPSPGNLIMQTYSNTAWYSATNFSLVAETLPWTGTERLFVTEKTFKPLELSHPFVIYGNQGTLPYLHGLGFETFNHIIDESYDLEPTLQTRLKSIDAVLKLLYQEFKQGKILFGDAESQRRIQHNYNRFHDRQAVNKLWQTQVVDVIQEFIHV
jgi:hypothetical protein